jgi:16S rRNA A1518/A1519 N6-dimethyltransferase RsmA/KsgA/DIM1 with predicted DNA glycosylase/AP lyase activity
MSYVFVSHASEDKQKRVRPVVEASFAHRRKRLANAATLSGLAPRAVVERALDAIGKSKDVRAEELTPEEFVILAGALA